MLQIFCGCHPYSERNALSQQNYRRFHISIQFLIGEYIRIDLYGRYQVDQLYYTSLESVKYFGLPLLWTVVSNFEDVKLHNISQDKESLRNNVVEHLKKGRVKEACTEIALGAVYSGLRSELALTWFQVCGRIHQHL